MWYLTADAVSGYETDLPPNEHLRTRTEGRLRASTSGYGEVRIETWSSVLEPDDYQLMLSFSDMIGQDEGYTGQVGGLDMRWLLGALKELVEAIADALSIGGTKITNPQDRAAHERALERSRELMQQQQKKEDQDREN